MIANLRMASVGRRLVAASSGNPLLLRACFLSTFDSAADQKDSYKVTQINDISSKSTKSYLYLDGIGNGMVSNEKNFGEGESRSSLIASMFHRAAKYFLPRGYPYSVAPGYIQYATGQSLSIMLSTIGGVLSMQSLLYAMGLSTTAAVAGGLAGSLNWVLKDGLGQLGGVLFASVVSNKFDADPKKWRFIASVVMDSSSFIELLSPLAPRFFLLIASVANVGKNIAYLAASASRAAIHKSFDIHENLADITAKTGSQSIVSSMLGTTVGIALAAHLGNPWANNATSTATSDLGEIVSTLSVLEAYPWLPTAGIFLTCSALSLVSTNWALKHVTVRTLTPQRLDIIIDDFCNGINPSSHMQNKSELDTRNILTPSQFSSIEKSVFNGYLQSRSESKTSSIDVCVGEDFDKIILNVNELKDLLSVYDGKKYFLKVSNEANANKGIVIYVSFLDTAIKKDVLHGLIHAFLMKNKLLRLEQSGKLKGSDQLDSILTAAKGDFVYRDDTGRQLNAIGDNTLSLIDYIYNRVVATSQNAVEVAALQNHNYLADLPSRLVIPSSVNFSLGKTDTDHLKWILDEMMLEPKFARINITKGKEN